MKHFFLSENELRFINRKDPRQGRQKKQGKHSLNTKIREFSPSTTSGNRETRKTLRSIWRTTDMPARIFSVSDDVVTSWWARLIPNARHCLRILESDGAFLRSYLSCLNIWVFEFYEYR